MNTTEKKGMGCWGIGCLILLGIFLVGSAVVGIGSYLTYRTILGYTSPTPVQLPIQEGTDEQFQSLGARVSEFVTLLNEDTMGTLELSADDINLAVAKNPEWKELKGRFFVQLKDNGVFGQVSFPLTKVPGFSDRYLNGTAGFSISIDHGNIDVMPISLEANGKTISKAFMDQMGPPFRDSFSENFRKEPAVREALSKIKSLKVIGDKIVIESAGTNPPRPIVKEIPVPEPAPEPAPIPEPVAPKRAAVLPDSENQQADPTPRSVIEIDGATPTNPNEEVQPEPILENHEIGSTNAPISIEGYEPAPQ
jgi:hypothetical protein